jgi:hypothetical protein
MISVGRIGRNKCLPAKVAKREPLNRPKVLLVLKNTHKELSLQKYRSGDQSQCKQPSTTDSPQWRAAGWRQIMNALSEIPKLEDRFSGLFARRAWFSDRAMENSGQAASGRVLHQGDIARSTFIATLPNLTFATTSTPSLASMTASAPASCCSRDRRAPSQGRRYRGGASYARLRSVARGPPGDRARIPRGCDGNRSE